MRPVSGPKDPLGLREGLKESLGPERLAFLQRLVLQRRIGDYLFVHAGLHPGRPLDDQTEHDMLWIREPFLSGHDWPHPVTVVHGHTPEGPTVLAHRKTGRGSGGENGVQDV